MNGNAVEAYNCRKSIIINFIIAQYGNTKINNCYISKHNMAIFGKSIVADLSKTVPAGTSNTVKLNRHTDLYALQYKAHNRHTYQNFPHII